MNADVRSRDVVIDGMGPLGGPKSFNLGRRLMYRRADVEQWINGS
jgi:hypothetical protein